ncbi:hypothetical protein POPTR_010G175801v4 [Populus trichocarpa]|uniref:Uncharacterized protein n=1 Tax=Populus trichocarpa TaxID=3694 RepID=A0ACC0SE27_POPTR|nr:hypothetical protein POPTR_010G175801v4 [Populus trichocarpa]
MSLLLTPSIAATAELKSVATRRYIFRCGITSTTTITRGSRTSAAARTTDITILALTKCIHMWWVVPIHRSITPFKLVQIVCIDVCGMITMTDNTVVTEGHLYVVGLV